MNKIIWWFMRTFRNKTLLKCRVGAFDVRFKKYWVEFKAPRDWYSLRLRADNEAASYLFYAAKKGDFSQAEGYIKTLYILSVAITKDQGLADDVSRAITKYHKRVEKQAESDFKAVSDAQNQADGRLLRESTKYAQMSRKQRKTAKEDMRATVREMVKDGEFDDESK
jgi:hypothetical protein